MRRALTTLAVAALALAGTTACEPPPPPASFTVNVAPGDTGDDADPGDGVCETAPGNGQCTLDAAVQEGNALGRADIHVPPAPAQGAYQVLTETTITGQLTLTSELEDNGEFELRAPELHIAAGARLSVEQAELWVTGTTTVSGALVLHRSMLVGWIDVSEDAWLSMVNSQGGAWASDLAPPTTNAWITNRGTVVLRFSYFNRFDHGPGTSMGAAFVHTLDGGATFIGATRFERYELTSPDCLGTPPQSEGYNHGQNCGLGAPGDHDSEGSPGGHQVPLGVAGCGTTVTVDLLGHPRPSATGGDTCESGP